MLNANGKFTCIYHKFKPNVGQYSIHGAFAWVCKCLRFICLFFGGCFVFWISVCTAYWQLKRPRLRLRHSLLYHTCAVLYFIPSRIHKNFKPLPTKTSQRYFFCFKILLHLKKKEKGWKIGTWYIYVPKLHSIHQGLLWPFWNIPMGSMYGIFTPLKFNIASKNSQSQKETHFPTIILQGLC